MTTKDEQPAPATELREQEICGGCKGSGWVTRGPDIGTDQECFVCEGKGTVEPEQPAQQERTDYAVHLNHCNIGEYEGVCKYLDDDCPALKHADMKAKWDSPTPQPAQQEPEHIVHSNGRYSPLLTRMMNERVKSNVKQVIELYDSPEQPAPVAKPHEQEPVECKTLCELCVKRSYHFCANSAQTTLIPSPPAQRTWVGLTEQEAFDCFSPNPVTHSKNVEAKLKEKNT